MIKLFNANYKSSVNQRYRERRFAFFKGLLANLKKEGPITILDVGGTQSYWENMNFADDGSVHITLLNLTEDEVTRSHFSSISGDATDLSRFGDKHFDIVHSNSVIEHLFTREAQERMANEVRRVGKCYYVQTPNYYFPIEPHWVFPLFQFLPFSLRVYLTKKFYLDSYPENERQEVAYQRVKEVLLLTEKDMKELFPEARIYREMAFGLKKSITSYYF